MNDPDFIYTHGRLEQIASDALRYAKEKGATGAEVSISEGNGLSVSVRKKEIETIEKNQDKGIGITVYIGKKRGNATTSDFSEVSVKQTVEAAFNIASFTSDDDAAGLPDPELLEKEPADLSLYHRWGISPEDAVEIARRCEEAAFDADPRIKNSEGAGVSVQHGHFVFANSDGFMGGYPYSRHSFSVAPIASQGDDMQRDYWYTASRNPERLDTPEFVGRKAASRAASRLNARQLETGKYPVLFDPTLAAGLVGAFVHAVSGSALYRKTTFLLGSLGKKIFPDDIELLEDPYVKGAMGSSSFDGEGVRTHRRRVVEDGFVRGYFLSSYSARKLGMKTTGNSGGSHNLILRSKKTKEADDFAAMLKKLDRGLVVTELMGQGINHVTGDYSRGAFGYWVENGVIQYPVQEITIAGNLKDMFSHIAAVGADTLIRGATETGSVLLEEMTVAGK